MEGLDLSVNENGNLTVIFTHNQWKVIQKALKWYAQKLKSA